MYKYLSFLDRTREGRPERAGDSAQRTSGGIRGWSGNTGRFPENDKNNGKNRNQN